jgi:NAD+ kinase
MSFPFTKIALIARRKSPELRAPVSLLATFLEKRGVSVTLEDLTATMTGLTHYAMMPTHELGATHDLVIVLGGDGTILSVARQMAPFNVPVLGVNQGRFGFLTDVPLAEMEAMVGEILDGKYVEEQRFMLMTTVERVNSRAYDNLNVDDDLTDIRLHALNDVVLGRSHTNTLIDFSLQVDGKYAFSLRADGLVISTPTGSTAYALSAGGPILSPKTPAFIIAPVAPYGLTHRPIVLHEAAKLVVTIRRGETVYLYADAQPQVEVHEGEQIQIAASPYHAHLIHPENHDYFAALREKLHWSQTPVRKE